MAFSSSIEQQHQEFKRQISAQDNFPCFLLDQSHQQRISSPTSNVMPSYLSAQAFSPLGKSPRPALPGNTSRQSNQYRLFPSSPSNNVTTTRTHTRSATQVVDVPIEKTIVPLRTMTDLFPSFSYLNMQPSNKSQSSTSSINLTNQLPSNPTGVSIFGFREADLDFIIEQFQDIGQIDQIERPLGCENGNFLNIIYTNHVSCQNALNRDGITLNGHMIGVVPLLTK